MGFDREPLFSSNASIRFWHRHRYRVVMIDGEDVAFGIFDDCVLRRLGRPAFAQFYWDLIDWKTQLR